MAEKKGLDISTIEFDKIIVHTLPKHKKNDKEIEPRCSEEPSVLTPGLSMFFKDKIVSSLGSDRSLRIIYEQTSTSPISGYANTLINGNNKDLIKISQKIAKHLFEVQGGTNNEGILVVITCTINKKTSIILIKLEMDTGAQLILDKNRNTYNIQEVEDLMLTKKTKIYKVALLIEKAKYGVKFDGILTDYQIDTKAKEEIKSWYINKFLGCIPFQDPKVTTQRFYNYTKAFINMIDDDVKKAKYHQDLNSYMLKNTAIISPTEFAEDYLLSTKERNDYKQYLKAKQFGFDSFTKDTKEIERRIQTITMEFANDITIVGKGGTFKNKVKLEKLENGQTRAEITSRVKKIK